MARLLERYTKELVAKLQSKLGRKNVLSLPRLQKIVVNMGVGKALQEECIEINRLENTADDLVRRLVTNLFESGMDAISVMKHKEIYEFLELAVDRCEDVADVLQTVPVKNS